ncbi:fungal hydrophobin [Macrolepiota fuliginosa MF-IS2]|uniref:Hydrophobin n=1 Tax=Macrolepiota fuliginosa MF-IS2 TaxID=1400762 RepID=A0A9P5X3F1_9AGAR|nr:fungal hydrophobin [Macrolepiota fuliginosa MF-IS2]
MFSKLAIFAAATFAVVTSAAPTVPMQNSCNVGKMQCCNKTVNHTSESNTQLLGTIGVAVSGVTGLIGLGCSPIDVLAVGGNSCNAQPVCCTGNNFNGLVAIGCTPINLNL